MSARIESTSRVAFRPAAGTACGQCPWRKRNQGTKHPGGWYGAANLKRLWSGLRAGERMTCHPTDPDNDIESCGCHEPPPPGTPTRECAGALVLVQREMTRVQDHVADCDTPAAARAAFREYRREHPTGLTLDGYLRHAIDMTFAEVPMLGGGLKVATPDLNDESVGYARLVPWVNR